MLSLGDQDDKLRMSLMIKNVALNECQVVALAGTLDVHNRHNENDSSLGS